MKKVFVLFLAILFVTTLFTGCNKNGNDNDNSVLINTTVEQFSSYQELQKYVLNLDTERYQIIGDYESYFCGTIYNLILIEKAKNESYEVFEFSDPSVRKEFESKISSDKRISYYEAYGFYYLIVISENTAEKSTATVKDILQNDENYIVITDDDNLVLIPKSICEFITSFEGNIVNFEKTAGTITKATFCITEEMQEKIQWIKNSSG